MESLLCLPSVVERFLDYFSPHDRMHLREVSKRIRHVFDSMTKGELSRYTISLDHSLHECVHTINLDGVENVLLGGRDTVFPQVRVLRVNGRRSRISSRALLWFPNLRVCEVRRFIEDCKAPTEMLWLETFYTKRSPWENILEACPSLQRLELYSRNSPLRIIGGSMDYVVVNRCHEAPLYIQLDSCQNLTLWETIPKNLTMNYHEDQTSLTHLRVKRLTLRFSSSPNIPISIAPPEKERHITLEISGTKVDLLLEGTAYLDW